MTSSLATISTLIQRASPEEASFYSLAYVSALQQCAASAYGPTLKSVVSSTASTSFYGDGLAECVVRCRLETEREATERLTAILLEESPPTPMRGRQNRDSFPILLMTGTDREGEGFRKPFGGGQGSRASSAASRSSGRASSSKASRSLGRKVLNGSSGHAISSSEAFSKDGVAVRSSPVSGASPSFPALSSAQVSQRDMAVLHFRIGLCRALGWPTPVELQLKGDRGASAGSRTNVLAEEGGGASELLTQLVDSLHSRYSYANALRGERTTDPGAALTTSIAPADGDVHMFMHLPDTELRQSIILDWVEDIFVFAHYQGFTTEQTQCVLLDSLLLLDLVDRHPVDTADAGDHVAWEDQVINVLQEVLSAQTCLTAARAIETVHRREPVTVEVPDPVQLNEIMEKQQKTTSPKVLAALEVARQGLPCISQTVLQVVEVEVEKDVTLRPVFSMSEAAIIAEYITRSVVMHRRLWGVLLAPVAEEQLSSISTAATAAAAAHGLGRPSVHRPICVAIEDISPVFIPPLSTFRTDVLQTAVDAQRRLFEAFEAEREQFFAEDWQAPLLAIAAEELSELRVLQEAAAQADAMDKAAALTEQQCARVERAYGLRLEDVLKHNTRVVRGTPPTALDPPAASKAPEVTTVSSPVRSNAGKTRKKNASGPAMAAAAAAPALSADAAASIVLPTDAAFGLAEVEARVDRIAAAVEEMNGAGSSQRTGSSRHTSAT
ncbi:hypothetical protein JKF63_00607 [Porcisia hertigi]|uniref:Uncharacterized protein n=1 Tax=Porcisia hertigi TaxID=2761500 RepID=A0A836HQA1_9TRYP|nr:hypothetical protein JKF63_00607 [Porcisia hertigi]